MSTINRNVPGNGLTCNNEVKFGISQLVSELLYVCGVLSGGESSPHSNPLVTRLETWLKLRHKGLEWFDASIAAAEHGVEGWTRHGMRTGSVLE